MGWIQYLTNTTGLPCLHFKGWVWFTSRNTSEMVSSYKWSSRCCLRNRILKSANAKHCYILLLIDNFDVILCVLVRINVVIKWTDEFTPKHAEIHPLFILLIKYDDNWPQYLWHDTDLLSSWNVNYIPSS